jgi:hypothetical protein
VARSRTGVRLGFQSLAFTLVSEVDEAAEPVEWLPTAANG